LSLSPIECDIKHDKKSTTTNMRIKFKKLYGILLHVTNDLIYF